MLWINNTILEYFPLPFPNSPYKWDNHKEAIRVEAIMLLAVDIVLLVGGQPFNAKPVNFLDMRIITQIIIRFQINPVNICKVMNGYSKENYNTGLCIYDSTFDRHYLSLAFFTEFT